MTALLDIALSELPGDLASWPAALGAMREVDAHEVLAALFEAWVAGRLEAHLHAQGETYRSFGALLTGLPERFTVGLSAERMADDEVDVRRWCWAPGWFLLSQDEDLMVMNDDCVSALLEEGAAGCPKREYVFGIVEHHVRDQMHHALWDGAATLPERLVWAGRVASEAALAGAADVSDYAARIASYAVQGAVKREDVEQRVFDLRRCHPNRTVPPHVRLEGDRWLARLDRGNALVGQLVIDRRTGAMRADETVRRR
jgi:hypothetical protein